MNKTTNKQIKEVLENAGFLTLVNLLKDIRYYYEETYFADLTDFLEHCDELEAHELKGELLHNIHRLHRLKESFDFSQPFYFNSFVFNQLDKEDIIYILKIIANDVKRNKGNSEYYDSRLVDFLRENGINI